MSGKIFVLDLKTDFPVRIFLKVISGWLSRKLSQDTYFCHFGYSNSLPVLVLFFMFKTAGLLIFHVHVVQTNRYQSWLRQQKGTVFPKILCKCYHNFHSLNKLDIVSPYPLSDFWTGYTAISPITALCMLLRAYSVDLQLSNSVFFCLKIGPCLTTLAIFLKIIYNSN